MAADNSWDARHNPSGGNSGAIISRPRLGTVDLILQLWRSKLLMILVGLIVFLPFVLLAFTLPTKYESSAGLLISLGEEQVYRPRVGSEAAGVVPEQELLNQAEMELMRSPIVAERVIENLSLERVFPDIVEDRALIALDNPGRDVVLTMKLLGMEAILKDFSVWSTPKSNVIRTSYSHEDPEISADVLNAIIDSYLEYRSEVYLNTLSLIHI